MSNCCYNPIVYCWMNDKFRAGFRYMFRWCPCVRRPDAPPYGRWMTHAGVGTPASPGAMTRSTGDRVRWASATVVSYDAAGASARVRTDLAAIPELSSAGSPPGSSAELAGSPLTAGDGHRRRRGQRDQLETVVESYPLKPTSRTATA